MQVRPGRVAGRADRARPGRRSTTRWPSLTAIDERCAYIVRTPSAWATTTRLPQPPASQPAQATRPAAAAATGVPCGARMSIAGVEAVAARAEGDRRSARPPARRARAGSSRARRAARRRSWRRRRRPARGRPSAGSAAARARCARRGRRRSWPRGSRARRAGTGARRRPSRSAPRVSGLAAEDVLAVAPERLARRRSGDRRRESGRRGAGSA